MTSTDSSPTRQQDSPSRWQVAAEICGWLLWGGASAFGYLTWFVRSTGFQEASGLLMALSGVSDWVLIGCTALAAVGAVMLSFGIVAPSEADQLVQLRIRAFRFMVTAVVIALGLISVGTNIGTFTHDTVDQETLEPGSGTTVRIMSHNLLYRNPNPQHSAQQILNQDADVLVLTEYTAVHRRALKDAGIDTQYSFKWEEVAGGGDGIAIWSKYPLDVHTVHLLSRATPQVTIDVNGVPLELIGVHLSAPTHRGSLPYWQADIDDLSEIVAASESPVVVVGDFNSTTGHLRFRAMMRTNNLRSAHDVGGGGLGGTWPTNFLVTPVMRIDHILLSPQHELVEYQRLGSWGSDHKAIAATLWLTAPSL